MTLQEARTKLSACSQEHLLKYYEELSEREQKHLLQQIEELDVSLLDIVKSGKIDATKGKIEPIKGMSLAEIEQKEDHFRTIGRETLRQGKVGAVLLAGGQGTRLGLDKPKGMLNVGLTKDLYLFEQLVHNLMDVTDAIGETLPLFVMTSEKNDEDTRGFFAEHDYFGYPKEKIYFFVQDMAPSVSYDGKIYMEAKGNLSTSPNGNGGWFSSMERAGLLDIMDELGVEWLNVFSVDNVLQRIADPVFVGATVEGNYDCGSKVVAKAAPSERVGVMCLENGKPSIVEYYEMTDEMLNQTDDKGSLVYNYGVTLNYLFRVSTLKSIMHEKLMLHIVEKKIPYIDEDAKPISPEEPNGYKFELLVLDMIRMMDTCLPFEVVREKEFAPIKNREGVDSLDTARELMRKNHMEF